MSDDDFESEADPEIQMSIFNWLAYEIATKHSVNLDATTGEPYEEGIRERRENGELCLCCNEQPSKDYDANKRWNEKGYCVPCLASLKAAKEYCETCKYSFPEHYMETEILCKMCSEDPDAPRLQV